MDTCFWQKSKKCPQCGYFVPEGPRPDAAVGRDDIWPDACHNYGYILHDDLPPTDDCKGFKTPAQLQLERAAASKRRRR